MISHGTGRFIRNSATKYVEAASDLLGRFLIREPVSLGQIDERDFARDLEIPLTDCAPEEVLLGIVDGSPCLEVDMIISDPTYM
jgi:hypothetical protein